MKLKEAMQANMPWLVENMDPNDHLVYLFSKYAITEEDFGTIEAEHSNEAMLSILILLGSLKIYTYVIYKHLCLEIADSFSYRYRDAK